MVVFWNGNSYSDSGSSYTYVDPEAAVITIDVAAAPFVPQVGPSLAAALGTGAQVSSIWADRATWNEGIGLQQFTKAGAPYTDPVKYMGYNIAPNNTKQILTEPMFSDRWECGFYNSGNGITSIERHVGAYIDPGAPQNGEQRPYSIYIDLGGDVVASVPRGRPHHLFTVGQPGLNGNGDTTFSVMDTSGAQWMTFGGGAAGSWSVFSQLLLQGRASVAGSSDLLIGGATGVDARVILTPATNASAALQWQQSGSAKWQWYQGNASDPSLYLRDLVNGKMALAFFPGTGVAGSLETSGSLKVDGAFGVNGTNPVGKASAIASPTSDTVGTKVAIDAIRVALQNVGITS